MLGTYTGAHAYSLTDALETAATRPAVEAAELEFNEARAELARTNADPFALKLEKIAAQQRLALSKARVTETYYAAVLELGTAYTARLQAELEQEAARANEALSLRLLEVARIRLQRGSVTELEVREAEAALGVAAATRQSAEETLIVTRTDLRALLPADVKAARLEPIPTWTVERPLPSVLVVLQGAGRTTALLSLQQAVSLASLNRSLLDPSYSSARELETADAALEAARTSLAEATRTLQAQLRTLYAQTGAAQQLFRAQRTTSAAAQSRLAFQRSRFSRGLISELELRQTEYAATSAQLEMMRAKHLYVTTRFELQAASVTQLWPLDTATNPLIDEAE
jgi:outer membrane protein TolC